MPNERQKKVLIHRYGGIGDIAPIMVVGEQLRSKGWHVTIALRHDGPTRECDLIENTNCYDEKLDLVATGPWGNRCVKYKHGWRSIQATYGDYDWILDYMNIVENNSTCNSTAIVNPTDEWQKTRNSNFVNWTDLHLAWANINPRSVPDKEKRPTFKLSKAENLEITKLRDKYKTIVVLQPFASSLARTWYQAKDLIPMLKEYWEDCLIACWDPIKHKWAFMTRNGPEEVNIAIDSPMRNTMTLIGACDLYIGADTGFSHVAEGLNRKHIVLYSTVPSWTRAQYYQHQTVIDKGLEHPEYHTFVINVGDPLRIQEGRDSLTEREKKIAELYTKQVPIEVAAKELNTDDFGIEMELKALHTKIESFSRLQSKALTEVTPEMVMDKVKELLK